MSSKNKGIKFQQYIDKQWKNMGYSIALKKGYKVRIARDNDLLDFLNEKLGGDIYGEITTR